MILVSPASVGLAVLLLFPAAAGAQKPEAGTTFSDTVEVREAEVEVLVTDRDGRPAPGLTAADFKILEDGKPVEVTSLSPTSAQPLVIAVFLDETSLSPHARIVAIDGLRSFFASALRQGDRVLLARFGGNLEIQGEPTGEALILGAALDRIAAGVPRGMMLVHERSSLQEDILQAMPPAGDDRQVEMALANARTLADRMRQYGEMRSGATRDALKGIQQELALLASLPERKALFYIGGGLPMRPGTDLIDLWMNKFGMYSTQMDVSPMETLGWDSSRMVQETADRANIAGITLHTLALPEAGTVTASGAGALGTRGGFDPESSDQALRTLAAATGGRVVTDMQNPAPFLEAAGRDIGAGYVLGYTPGSGGKKGRHKLKVTVRDGSLAARYREERFDGAGGDPLLRSAAAALWGGESANPLRAELSIEEQTPEEDGRIRVIAIVSLPLASVLVKPQEHFHVAHLTLAIVARDGKGRITGSPRAEFPVEIPNERLLSATGQTAGYRFTMHLSPGDSVVAVALRDEASGTESVTRISLTSGAGTAARK